MVKCRIAYIIILLVTFGFYVFYSDYLSFLALLFVLLLPIFLFILVLLASRKLSAKLNLTALTASKSEQIPIQIAVQNKFFLPLPRVEISIRIENILNHSRKEFSLAVPVGARDRETITWTMTSENCGQVCFTIEKLYLYDYFGLFGFAKQEQQSKHVFVLPQHQLVTPKVDSSNQMHLDSNIYSSAKPGDDSSETFGIREYAPGDSPRSIHWKLSAKLDHLMIRQFSFPINSSYLILLELTEPANPDELPEQMDNMIECMFSLSRFLMMNQMYHTVAWYNDKLKTLDQTTITCEKDHPLLLKQILCTHCYQKNGMALQKYIELYSENPSSHFFYLTPSTDISILRQIIPYLRNDRNTVFQFVSSSADALSPNQSEPNMLCSNTSIRCITGDTMKPILDQLVV